MNRNLLILGGGRRLELCRRFRDYGYNLFLYEKDKQNPASKLLNIPTFEGKSWNDISIYHDLQKVIDQNNINAILPLDCEAVFRLAINAPNHWNIIGRNKYQATLGYDKKRLKDIFEFDAFVYGYYPWPKSHAKYIRKPRFGSGSIGIEKLENYYEPDCENRSDTLVTQKFLTGKEISIDCYFSKFNSYLINYCARERTRVCGPEVIDSITVEPDSRMMLVINSLNFESNFKGPINFQFMYDENNNPFITEINSRIGGGTVLSIEAGLDLPRYIDDEYFRNISLTPSREKRKIGVRMIRALEGAYFENSI